MSATATGLKDLHEVHQRLQKVYDKLEEGPKRLKARQQIALKKQAEIDTAKDELQQIRKTADQKSLQLKSNESKIGDLKAKLNEAASNREYDIITGQIEADKMANSVLEDEILESYDKVEEQQQLIAGLEDQLKTAHEECDRFQKEFDDKKPALDKRVEELSAELKEAETCIPTELKDQYKRLVGAFGSDALAPVEDKACTNCFTMLAPNEIVELNVGKFRFCRACGRLLYLNN